LTQSVTGWYSVNTLNIILIFKYANFIVCTYIFSHTYITNAAYAKSKLAQIMSTKYYNKILANTNVEVFAVHPGIVNTELFNGTLLKMTMPWILSYICKVNYKLFFLYILLFVYYILLFNLRPQKKDHEVLFMLAFLQN